MENPIRDEAIRQCIRRQYGYSDPKTFDRDPTWYATWKVKEKMVEDFFSALSALSSAAMVDLVQRARRIADEELTDHAHYPERGVWTLEFLERLINSRTTKKYLQAHPTVTAFTDPREIIEYSDAEEAALKDVLLSLKPDTNGRYSNINFIMEKITGRRTNL